MKKIIILAIALLSTGIVVSENIQKNNDTAAKTAALKIQKNTVTERNIANDAVASAD